MMKDRCDICGNDAYVDVEGTGVLLCEKCWRLIARVLKVMMAHRLRTTRNRLAEALKAIPEVPS